MMMKRLLLLSLLCVTLSTCKKYPEGPVFSLLTKEGRIEGSKIIDQYLIDGIDSLNTLFDSTLLCAPSTPFKFVGKIQAPGSDSNYWVHTFETCFGTRHRWRLINKKRSIEFYSLGAVNPNPGGYIFLWGSWEIQRLTKTDFWIQQQMNGHVYEIKFRSI